MNPQLLLAELPRLHDYALSNLGLQTPAEYNQSTLERLETGIKKTLKEGDIFPATALTLGTFLGECLVRNLKDCHWNLDEISNGADLKITAEIGKTTVLSYPVKRAMNFMRNFEDSMIAYYICLEFMSQNGTTDTSAFKELTDEHGWVHFPSGMQFRVRTIFPHAKSN